MTICDEIRRSLLALQDPGYREFHCRLIPNVSPDTVIGVRTPALKAAAKAFAGHPELDAFFRDLPHRYYDENNLHGFLISQIGEPWLYRQEVERFLPYVDNWATCDLMRPRAIRQDFEAFLPDIRRWMASDHPYTVRFGMEMLMVYGLDDRFSPEFLQWVAEVQSEEYYVNMMIAWYFATALAKQEAAALPYLLEERLGVWVHNKTIQKAVESDRIAPERKRELRILRRKQRER